MAEEATATETTNQVEEAATSQSQEAGDVTPRSTESYEQEIENCAGRMLSIGLSVTNIGMMLKHSARFRRRKRLSYCYQCQVSDRKPRHRSS